MESLNYRPVFSVFFVFLLLRCLSPAAAKPDFKYENESKIVQYISWEAQEDALRYELVVEKLDGKTYSPVLRETTEATTLKTSLPAGEYRYRVLVWDLLGRQRPPANWSLLTVKKVLKPEIAKVEPVLFNLQDKADFKLKVDGKNFLEGARGFLAAPDGSRIEARSCKTDEDENEAELAFDKSALKTGVYSVVIENPGALEAELPNFMIFDGKEGPGGGARMVKPLFMFSEGYMMMLPVIGEIVKGESLNYFDSAFYPYGLKVDFGMIPLKGRGGAFGFELSGFWSRLSNDHYDNLNGHYTVAAHLFGAGANLLYQTPLLLRHLIFNFEAGGGVVVVYGLNVVIENKRISDDYPPMPVPLADAGLSVIFLLRDVFFIEAGADFLMLFYGGKTPSFVNPAVSIGWKF